jgi:hypothetical protein
MRIILKWITDFRLSWWITVDVDSALVSWHFEDVSSGTNVSEEHFALLFSLHILISKRQCVPLKCWQNCLHPPGVKTQEVNNH